MIHSAQERKDPETKWKRKKPSSKVKSKRSKENNTEEVCEKTLESVEVKLDPRVTFKKVPEKDKPAVETQTEEVALVKGTKNMVTIGT